jgi:hypothetical protein
MTEAAASSRKTVADLTFIRPSATTCNEECCKESEEDQRKQATYLDLTQNINHRGLGKRLAAGGRGSPGRTALTDTSHLKINLKIKRLLVSVSWSLSKSYTGSE